MSSHTGRTFLNSCLKTPIDPCNNCPAPIYNRPKMYLGRLSTITPLSNIKWATRNSVSVKNTPVTESTETNVWASGGIRSLAKLYDSIPDYCDIHHLTEEEFYSTLDSLRSTCHELKTKPLNTSLLDENVSSSTLTTNSSTVKGKKLCKKKNGSTNKSGSKKKKDGIKSRAAKKADLNGKMKCNSSVLCEENVRLSETFEKAETKSCRNDFQAEVEAFKQTLKDFEDELISKTYCKKVKRAKSTNLITELPSSKPKVDEKTQTDFNRRIPNHGSDCNSQKNMRKAYSFNDINELSDTGTFKTAKAQGENPLLLNKLTNAESLAFKNIKRPSNYFEEPTNSVSHGKNELPKISIQSPSSDNTTSATTTERSIQKIRNEKTKVPFSIFTVSSGSAKVDNFDTPSPVHPVARPNLAATLRAEVSKKKLKELQNNCTFFDRTPHNDWEVRKTPAWRSLALNESHKEILALRLATRKAEQALQQREYELNMELMRRRVKSAPLLLEGATYWGPNVGKLTHKCQTEGIQHACEGIQRKNKLRHRTKSDNLNELNIDGSRAKFNELRKIYVSNAKPTSNSRNSEQSFGRRNNKERTKVKKTKDSRTSSCLQINDSGDELSSTDRAFL